MNQGNRMSKGLKTRAALLAVALLAVGAVQAAEVPVPREGYALMADRQGEGALAVVFESGFGQGADAWEAVIADLGADCTCIAYSRAGLGASGSDDRPKTIEAHVADLGAVIDALAADRKIVLVGHSYGGLLATEFARKHPERLQGLVLVDPATMGQRHAALQIDRERVLADDATLLKMLPPPMGADYQGLIDQLDASDAAAPRAMPDLPTALLTATQVAADPFVFEETAAGKAMWKAQHAALFAQLSRGTHRYFSTGHNIHHENPKAVADAIREVAAMQDAAAAE